jgi:cell division protein ZapA
MPHAQVNIGGRPYKLACNAGEEEHLAALAALVDGRIADMQGEFREIADQRIVVMAALSIADELFEARRKSEAQERETTMRETTAREAAEARIAELEAAIEEAAARVEALTESLPGTD